MKFVNVLFLGSLFVAAIAVLMLSSRSGVTVKPEVLGTPDVSATPEALPHDESSLSDYRFAWTLANSEALSLIPNFDDRENSVNLKEKYGCSALVNAGFYKRDQEEDKNMPIGLMIVDGVLISDYQNNSLFNGVLSVNEFDTPRITLETPKDKLKYAAQTGPVLQENDQTVNLKLKRDEEARRVVAAVTGENKLMFIVFYKEGAAFSGPTLLSMPALIEQFEKETSISLADVINLDGGSASAFINDSVSLTEISPVGSFFCIK